MVMGTNDFRTQLGPHLWWGPTSPGVTHVSYCRWGAESDVYVFSDGERWVCHLLNDEPMDFTSRQAALNYLLEAREHGYQIPELALNRLRREIATNEQRSPIKGERLLRRLTRWWPPT